MIQNQDIVCIGNTTWFGEYQKSTVQLLSRIGKYNKILYVDYAFTFKDLILGILGKNKAPVKRILGLQKRWQVIEEHNNGKIVKLTLPPVIPFNHFTNNFLFRQVLKFNSKIIAFSIKKAMKQLQMNNIISITSFMPFYGLFLKGKLNEKLNIYYCYDPIDGKRNGPRGLIYETDFIKDIDAVIVTSDYLAEQKKLVNPITYVVKNGVDYLMFRNAVVEKNKLENPKIVCYTGSIDQRFETEIVEYCIKNSPEYQFIFVGPVRNKNAAEKISKYPNVILKAPVPYKDIPLIMFNSHVGIIPYTRTRLNKNVYPLKINEYLAVGTPIVMTDFAMLTEFDNLVSVAADKETFLNKINYEIEYDTSEKQMKRIRFASNNSWDNRAKYFSEILESLLNKKNDIAK